MTDRQIQKVIGGNVRAARLKANLTQECLAELIGVHWQTVSYLEKGKFSISAAALARISQVLGVSANELFSNLPQLDIDRIEKIKKALARRRKSPVL